jgi:hypothetical protein
LGCTKATMKNRAEHRVEYNDVIRRPTEYPLRCGSSRPWVYKSGSMLLELSNQIKHLHQVHAGVALTLGVSCKAPHTPSILRRPKKGVVRKFFSRAWSWTRHGVGLMVVPKTIKQTRCIPN